MCVCVCVCNVTKGRPKTLYLPRPNFCHITPINVRQPSLYLKEQRYSVTFPDLFEYQRYINEKQTDDNAHRAPSSVDNPAPPPHFPVWFTHKCSQLQQAFNQCGSYAYPYLTY